MKSEPLVILIHGAWLGGWSWCRMTPMLSGHGLPVMAPTLLGCAERQDSKAGDVGLYAHVDELEHILRGSEQVVLIGHSYGAVVATELAGRLGDSVEKIIVLDGFLGVKGKSIMNDYPELDEMFAQLVSPESPAYIQLPPSELLGVSQDVDMNWLMPQMQPMPVKSFSEPLRYDSQALRCPRYYVRFNQFPLFQETAVKARGLGWAVSEIDAPHMAIYTHSKIVVPHIIHTCELH